MSPFANRPKLFGFASLSHSDGTSRILAFTAAMRAAFEAGIHRSPSEHESELLANQLLNNAG